MPTHHHQVLAHENQQEFNALLDNLRTQNAPANAHQDFLVLQMAIARWQLARAQRLEAKAFEHLAGLPATPRDPESRIVTKMFETNPNAVTALQRYAQNAERSYYRAVRELKADQKLPKQTQRELECGSIEAAYSRVTKERARFRAALLDSPAPSLPEDHWPWPNSAPSVPSVPLR